MDGYSAEAPGSGCLNNASTAAKLPSAPVNAALDTTSSITLDELVSDTSAVNTISLVERAEPAGTRKSPKTMANDRAESLAITEAISELQVESAHKIPDSDSAPNQEANIMTEQYVVEPGTSVGHILLAPKGDMVIVLTNKGEDEHHPFIHNILDAFSPEGNPPSSSSALPDRIHIRVISHLLEIVSDGFKAILNPAGGWKVLDDNTRVYRDDDDLCSAMIMVLMIIFGKHKHNPNALTMEQLKDVCVILDKYRLQDAVQPVTDTWLSKAACETYVTYEQVEIAL